MSTQSDTTPQAAYPQAPNPQAPNPQAPNPQAPNPQGPYQQSPYQQAPYQQASVPAESVPAESVPAGSRIRRPRTPRRPISSPPGRPGRGAGSWPSAWRWRWPWSRWPWPCGIRSPMPLRPPPARRPRRPPQSTRSAPLRSTPPPRRSRPLRDGRLERQRLRPVHDDLSWLPAPPAPPGRSRRGQPPATRPPATRPPATRGHRDLATRDPRLARHPVTPRLAGATARRIAEAPGVRSGRIWRRCCPGGTPPPCG